MRYVFVIIALITLVGSSYFNSVLREVTDFKILSNSQTYLTSGDKYKEHMKLQFRENTALLEDIEPIYNQMVKDILNINISKNGQSTKLIGAIPVGGSSDNAWGAYESNYKIGFQGYQLNTNEFQNTMSFVPEDVSSLYRCPVPLTFDGTYTGDYVVMKYNPINKFNGGESADNSLLNKLIHGVRQSNSKGLTPSFTSSDINLFQQFISNSDVSQIFQASIQQYYSSLVEKSNIFTDSSGIYLTHFNQDILLDNYGELQWIYDNLIKEGYDDVSASKMVFVANLAFFAEYQSMELHHQNSKIFNAWTLYKDRDLISKLKDWYRLEYTDDNDIIKIKDAIYAYIDLKSKDTISPLMMFTSINVFENEVISSDKLNLLKDLLDASDKVILKDLTLDLSDLSVRDDILAMLYISLTGDSLSKNGRVSNNINDFKFDDGISSSSIVKSYKIINDGNLKKCLQSILVNPETKTIADAFNLFVKECSSKTWGKYIKVWAELNPSISLDVVSTHGIGRAFFEYVSHLATQDLKNVKINYFTVDNITYPYMYPYMATGEMLLQILEETQERICTSQLGSTNYNQTFYIVYSNFDKIDFEAKHNINSLSGINISTLKSEQSFLRNKIKDEVVLPIVVGAYFSSENDGGFNLNNCLWSKPNWKDNIHYVDIYSILYNDITIEELEKYGGKVLLDAPNILSWFNNLEVSRKSIQCDKAVDYSKILKGIRF